MTTTTSHPLPSSSSQDRGTLRMDLPYAAVDRAPLGIARVDRRGSFTYANRHLLRMAGLDHWEGQTIYDRFRGKDREKVIHALKRREQLEGDAYDVWMTRADGPPVHVSITGFPETDSDGEQIGALSLVRDLTVEDTKQAMYKLVEELDETGALLDAIGKVLQPVVPHDLLQVQRLNRDRTHLRTIYSSLPDVVTERAYRWWTIPSLLRRLMESREPLAIVDLRSWYQDRLRENLKPNPAIEQFLAQGFTSTLSLPLFRNGLQVGSIVLARRGGRAFTDDEGRTADELPLTEAVSVALRNDTEGTLQFLLALMRHIASAYSSVSSVAQTIVDKIVEHYGWHSVSIYAVDSAHDLFRLIAQQASRDELKSERTEIPIDRGVLGHVYREQRSVRIADIDNSEFRDVHIRHRKAVTKSELCVPIGENVQWLLNVEDERTEAFTPEDMADLETIAASLYALLRRTVEYHYRTAIVRCAKDAILLVDDRNMVFEVNEAARELLGRSEKEILGQPIADFLADPGHAATLLEGGAFFNHGARMLQRSKNQRMAPVDVLLSVATLPAETPGRVFIASDLSQYVRGDELEVARTLLREVTGQIKTPMSLAISWLRRCDPRAEAGDFPEKILQQLRKAELTLDRMLLIERRSWDDAHASVLLRIDDLVGRAFDELPERERRAVKMACDAPDAWVRADAYEVRYCIQTALTYLLRLAPGMDGIEVRTTAASASVAVEIGGPAPAPGPDIDLQLRGGQVAAELALGRQTLARLAARNGGAYDERDQPGRRAFRFTFRRAASGDLS